MKKNILFLFLCVLIVAVSNVSAYTSLVLLEDFEDLSFGSINMQHEIDEWGFSVELWNSQSNSELRMDSGLARVVEGGVDGGKCLELSNHWPDGCIEDSYACMYLGDANAITDIGTIYLVFKSDSAGNCMLGLNNLLPGYESDLVRQPIGDEEYYQGTANYQMQNSLVRLSASSAFMASHYDNYIEVNMDIHPDTWYELWMHIDVNSRQTRYYICQVGEYPSVIINPQTGWQWWPWRTTSSAGVSSIKFFVGLSESPNTVYIDNISYSHDFATAENPCCPCEFMGGDVDMDGDTDIYDFLILRANYGIAYGATWSMGDLDSDGDVDIYDFLTLRSFYGKSGGIGNVD